MAARFLGDFPMDYLARSGLLQAFPSACQLPRVDEHHKAAYLRPSYIHMMWHLLDGFTAGDTTPPKFSTLFHGYLGPGI